MKRAYLIFVSCLLAGPLHGSYFEDASRAASEGRYQDVVTYLSSAIDMDNLDKSAQVAAFANRGVAHSLLGDFSSAEEDLLKAYGLEPGNGLTLNHLGILSERHHQDLAAAADWYQQAVDAGFTSAAINLAVLYRDGRGVASDPGRAFNLYESAARAEHPAAYTALGQMYLEGIGTRQDPALALDWLNRGAIAGAADANYYLGMIYEQGAGDSVAPDPEAAVEFYRVAAEAGYPRAQNRLGNLHRTGRGVPRNLTEATVWYEMAATAGVFNAKAQLAWLYATCPVTDVCDGDKAVELAQEVYETKPTTGNLDTLAAAYARSGRFEQAVELQEQVLQQMSVDFVARARYERRLELYRTDQPFQL